MTLMGMFLKIILFVDDARIHTWLKIPAILFHVACFVLVTEGGVKTAEVCSIHFLWGQCILGVGKEKEGR